MNSTATSDSNTTEHGSVSRQTLSKAKDIVGLVTRVVLGVVLVVAGYLKVIDPVGSTQSVVAYDIFGYEIARFIGLTLPVIEIAVGVLLIVGLFSRAAGALGAGLMVVFVTGIASAWARGLAIDCGCFGTGGPIDPRNTQYAQEIARDTALAAAGLWVVLRPRTLFSLDGLCSKFVPDERND